MAEQAGKTAAGDCANGRRDRDERGRFVNHAGPGRPKGITLHQALEQVSDPLATAQLLEDFIHGRVKGASPQVRLDALKYKINRELGMPRQTTDVNAQSDIRVKFSLGTNRAEEPK